eukprot:6292_1
MGCISSQELPTEHISRYAILVGFTMPTELENDYPVYSEFYKNFYTQNATINHINEEWNIYALENNEFPTANELVSLSGIIITGSLSDAFDNNIEWVIKLRALIKTIVNDSKYKHIKLIGHCFGHQIIAHSLEGGKTAKNPNGIEYGTREIVLNEMFNKIFPQFHQEYNTQTLFVYQMHYDAVISLPKNAILMGSSKWTQNEIFVIGDRVLAIQGHPEYTNNLMISFVDYCFANNLINNDQHTNSKQSLQTKADYDIWSKLFNEWLRR